MMRNGWTLIDEGEHAWLLAPPGDQNAEAEPVPIPKRGHIVDPELMNWICGKWPTLGQIFSYEVGRVIHAARP